MCAQTTVKLSSEAVGALCSGSKQIQQGLPPTPASAQAVAALGEAGARWLLSKHWQCTQCERPALYLFTGGLSLGVARVRYGSDDCDSDAEEVFVTNAVPCLPTCDSNTCIDTTQDASRALLNQPSSAELGTLYEDDKGVGGITGDVQWYASCARPPLAPKRKAKRTRGARAPSCELLVSGVPRPS